MNFKIYTLFIVLLTVNIIKAQPPRGLGNGQGQMPSITVKGKILDTQTGKPVEYATVAVVSLRDSSKIFGALTDDNGVFEIDQLLPGKYFIKAQFIGYKTLRTDTLKIAPSSESIDLGTFSLTPSSKMLEDVEVKGEKEIFQSSIDKKVFNVEKSNLAIGGSATDVMKQIPTVTLDQDGNISMRGNSNITVWINGKPSGMTGNSRQAILDQLPANSIESVELITNPSARYDAEGMGGIINIILKKNRADGINGTATAGFGTRDAYNVSNKKYNDINKYNAAFTLNLKTGKFNISTNYGYRYNHSWHIIDNQRLTLEKSPYWMNQFTYADNLIGQNHNAGANIDYTINDKNTIGIGAFTGFNIGNNPETIRTYWTDNEPLRNIQFFRTRTLDNRSDGYNLDGNAYYRKNFDKKGQELNISGSYSYSEHYQDGKFVQIDSAANLTQLSTIPSKTGLKTDGINNTAVFQVDYIHPMGEKTKLEFGAKSTYRHIFSGLLGDSISRSTFATVTDYNRTNDFVFMENVNAAYGILNQGLGKYGLQVGLRAEQTNISGTLLPNNFTSFNEIKNSQRYFNLFPSIHATRKLENEQELRASYSMRINRPGQEVLNPFPTWNNPLDLRYGNPLIKPEIVHSTELSYTKNWDKTSLILTGYFRQTDNTIQRVRRIDTTGTTPNISRGSSIMEFQNLSNSQNYGLEFILRNQITKWWNITTNINAFRNVINGLISNANFTGDGRIMSTMTVWKGINIQISGNYMLPRAMAQGTFQGFNGVDIGVRKDLFKNKAYIVVNLSDVFNTKNIQVEFNNGQSAGFSGGFFRQRETRVLTVNFTYKFGKELNNNVKRGKKAEYNTEGGGGGF